MILRDLISAGEWFFLGYYVTLHAIYFVLLGVAYTHWSGRRERSARRKLTPVYSGLEPPISIVMPLYNEGKNVVKAVRSLLGQRYPDVEVVLVNDGSSDDTLEIVTKAFAFGAADLEPDVVLPHQPVRGRYRSRRHDGLILIDKENGGKSDALNAGTRYSSNTLVCLVDGDSVLEPDSLQRAVQPFLEDPDTVAVGATLGVLNGCTVRRNGFVKDIGTASNFWVLVQTLEYIRAFMFFRLGWTILGSMPLISGAFGLYSRSVVVAGGGFRRDTAGEDVEMTLRLHRYSRQSGRAYYIGFVPGYACWTEVPDDYRSLRSQRITWHESLLKALAMNRGLPRAGGVAGRAVYPFMILFEALAPLVELTGYAFVVMAWVLGMLSVQAILSFVVLVLGLSILLSVCSILLETRTGRSFDSWQSLLMLFSVGIVENIGYRQLHAVWRFTGAVRWLLRPGTTLRPNLALAQTITSSRLMHRLQSSAARY